ncbi:MAG TPA: TIM barrel protein [Isosphaeraceae bacterium]|nr:TIM barrel protein [Isosphaeraceae bacterium]
MSLPLTRRSFLHSTVTGLAGAALLGAAEGPSKKPLFPFYAMDTGLRAADVPTLDAKVQLLKKLGFVGIGYTLNHRELPDLLDLLDKEKLELSAVYTTPLLEGKLDPDLAGSIKRMKGRSTRIELAISSKKYKPSDPDGDKLGIEMLKTVSDLTADTGPVVSVYPHRGSWTERVEDGYRLAKQVDRNNVGTHFNLVHWKWVKNAKPLEDLLKEVLPHLLCVTVNGLQGDTIVSLDQGDYDIDSFVVSLKKVGYRGPVGLQAYSVKGPSGEHLQRSMNKWREVMKKVEA